MIKAIILDVDGVIVGEKIGFNSPYPHPDVISRLKTIRAKSIPKSLCTAKPHYSVFKIINDANLANLHITNGGGVIIDPINNVILKKHVIEPKIASEVIDTYVRNRVYTEFYTTDEYVVQENQITKITTTHEHILQRKPRIVPDLTKEALNSRIVKIMPIAKNEDDKLTLTTFFEPFKSSLTLSWGIHPIALPHQFGIITAKGISKKQAVSEIAQSEKVRAEDILAIGDSTSDWQFIESCGYGATMANASDELKRLIVTKKRMQYFIGNSVDANGILNIFDYFSL